MHFHDFYYLLEDIFSGLNLVLVICTYTNIHWTLLMTTFVTEATRFWFKSEKCQIQDLCSFRALFSLEHLLEKNFGCATK